jgi:hypothetical protein
VYDTEKGCVITTGGEVDNPGHDVIITSMQEALMWNIRRVTHTDPDISGTCRVMCTINNLQASDQPEIVEGVRTFIMDLLSGNTRPQQVKSIVDGRFVIGGTLHRKNKVS